MRRRPGSCGRRAGGASSALSRVLAATAVLVMSAAPRAAVSRTVTFRTDDGVNIAATLYEAPGRPAPAVILLHMLTRSRDDWQGVANRLADSGIHALAIDFRGHGGSSAAPPAPDGEPDWSRMALDVKAASAFLTARPDLVRGASLGIAGASLGANVAVIAASSDLAIKSLALLSPGIEYRSLRADVPMRKYGMRPALLVAGTNDSYAMRSVKELAKLGAGTREIRALDSAGHGSTMLTRDPDLALALVDWFRRTLL
jgi:alpha-beta hydrolase superfamily lysophospholipase